jgi:hypothetical protein
MNYRDAATAALLERIPVSNEAKIFCLSLPKTGTTSLHCYLEDAGLRVSGAGPMRELTTRRSANPYERFVRTCIERLQACQAFEDQPWCFFGDVYTGRFPNAKYVILMRSFESWYRSFRFHLADRPETAVTNNHFLGILESNSPERDYRYAYEAHYEHVARTTQGLPSISIHIDQEDNASICERLNVFLGLSVAEFPHELRHERMILSQVRIALDADGSVDRAKAILAKYRSIHGAGPSFFRAKKLVQKAKRNRQSGGPESAFEP